MRKLAVWQMSKGTLARIDEASIELEKHLETWIAEDPTLLQAGLVIVGRQVQLGAGPLDLLGIDPQGRWVVIEIKRGDLDRKAVTQVLDYAACVSALSADELRSKTEAYLSDRGLGLEELLEQRGALDSLDPEQRQVLLVVVGTGTAPGLERVVNLLSKHTMPISVILFDVFKLDGGRLLLARGGDGTGCTTHTCRHYDVRGGRHGFGEEAWYTPRTAAGTRRGQGAGPACEAVQEEPNVHSTLEWLSHALHPLGHTGEGRHQGIRRC